MLQTSKRRRIDDSVYSFIGDAGRVTAAELSGILRIDQERAAVWLRSQANAGYLYTDERGTYATSCPWPRSGF